MAERTQAELEAEIAQLRAEKAAAERAAAIAESKKANEIENLKGQRDDQFTSDTGTLGCLLALFCWPFRIMSLINNGKAEKAAQRGDLKAAEEFRNKAARYRRISTGCALVITLIFAIVVISILVHLAK